MKHAELVLDHALKKNDMEVVIHANVYEESLSDVVQVVRPLFDELGKRLSGEYGGVMEHLWIDLELIESRASQDGKPRHAFRLQKRVSGHSRFGLPAITDKFNVGHFGVRPDFAFIATQPKAHTIKHVLTRIFETSSVLLAKQKRLGGFDASRFREKFYEECSSLGYLLG